MCEKIVRIFAMAHGADLFTKLGGTCAMAELLGKPPSTVQSWKAAGRIPAAEQPLVIERARGAGYEISADDVVWPLGQAAA